MVRRLGGAALVVQCGAAGGVVLAQGEPGVARDIARLFASLRHAAARQVVHVTVIKPRAFYDFIQ